MTIKFTLNSTNYSINVQSSSYTAIKHVLNKTEGSANLGTEKPREIGFFTKFANACQRCCREELSMSPDEVTLLEFAQRTEALNQELLAQLDRVENPLITLAP